MKIALLILAGVGAVVIILAGVLGFVVFPNIVDSTIEKELRLVRGTDVWNKWSDITSPIYMSFYVYNVTNPDEVEAGANPVLQELGPYAYRQWRSKVDPHSITCKETVTYEQKTTYFFDQQKSGNNKESDLVNVFNVPFISLIAGINRAVGPNTAGTIARYYLPRELIVRKNVTVGDLTFNGFPVTDYNNSFLLPFLPVEFSGFRFGLYRGRNGSTDGLYEVYTGAGKDGAKTFGQIKAWRGSKNLTFWNETVNPKCNDVSGSSDGSLFPPFMEPGGEIKLFSSDLCRSLNLGYREEITINDIKAYRYTPTQDTLKGPANDNTTNACYCVNKPNNNMTLCKDGTIDVSVCRGGAPIILSTPHFLDGYSGYAEAMGLSPIRDKHETTIDIEPRTGLLMGAHKRIQINIELNRILQVPQHALINETMLLPVLWVDEEASMCDMDVDDFKSRIEKPIKTIKIVRWVFIGIGIALIVVSVGLLIFLRKRTKTSL